jgi:molybdopterin converting factor small subunit
MELNSGHIAALKLTASGESKSQGCQDKPLSMGPVNGHVIRGMVGMPIRVKLHGRLRMAAGSDQIELPETVKNVGELLEELIRRTGPEAKQYVFDPGTKELSPSLIMLVNGHSIRMLEGLSTPLMEMDTVTIDSVDIMEIVGGG